LCVRPPAELSNAAAWLKSRADEFYLRGDLGAAINSYTDALRADPGQASLYLNRAACLLARFEFSACASDCEAALKLLNEPHVRAANESLTGDARAALRRKAHLRRAAALHSLGRFGDALAACLEAGAAHLDDELLAECVSSLQGFARAHQLKVDADAAAQGARSEDALRLYADAAVAAPGYAVCHLNSAAVCVSLGRWTDCVAACQTAIDSLEQAEAQQAASMVRYPVPGTALHARCLARALVRRATALQHLGRPHDARADFDRAATIPSADVSLERDLAALRLQLDGHGSTTAGRP
jgi:tetratricopeptide (TPR) repeat protein